MSGLSGYDPTSPILESAQRSLEALLAPYSIATSQNLPRLAESQVRQISNALSRIGKESWSRVPRIYAVLHMTKSIHFLDAFINDGVSDLWFPFTHKTLPECLRSPSARFDFLELQDLVLTKALDLEREDGSHRHFSKADELPLVKLEELGKGGFGYVDRVQSTITYKEYARKLIPRGRTFKKNTEVLKDYERELAHLKRLRHLHIVEFVGSYTDSKFVGILMAPVADYNLKDFMAREPLPQGERSFLRTFYGCLASALCYLHENKVRHKDIKPQNVLVKGHQVFLTDFGISLDWSDLGQSTTTGITFKTPRYCAPEVADYMPRNTSADVWSLGCIYLEIWSVLMGQSVSNLMNHLENHGSKSTCYYLNPASVTMWCDLLSRKVATEDESPPMAWIQGTLKVDQEERWTAQKLVDQIAEANDNPEHRYAFSGVCCIEGHDSTDSHASSKRSSRYLDETGVSSIEAYFPKSSDFDLPEHNADAVDAEPSTHCKITEQDERVPDLVPSASSMTADQHSLSAPMIHGLGIRTDDTSSAQELSNPSLPIDEPGICGSVDGAITPQILESNTPTADDRTTINSENTAYVSTMASTSLDNSLSNPSESATAAPEYLIDPETPSLELTKEEETQEATTETVMGKHEVTTISEIPEVRDTTVKPQGGINHLAETSNEVTRTAVSTKIEQEFDQMPGEGDFIHAISNMNSPNPATYTASDPATCASTGRFSAAIDGCTSEFGNAENRIHRSSDVSGTTPIENVLGTPSIEVTEVDEQNDKSDKDINKNDSKRDIFSVLTQAEDMIKLQTSLAGDSSLNAVGSQISASAQDLPLRDSRTDELRRTKSAASVTPEQTWTLWEEQRMLTKAAHRRGLSVEEYQALQRRSSEPDEDVEHREVLTGEEDQKLPVRRDDNLAEVTTAIGAVAVSQQLTPPVPGIADVLQQVPRHQPIFKRRDRDIEALYAQVHYSRRGSDTTNATASLPQTGPRSPTSPQSITGTTGSPQYSPTTDKSSGGFFGKLRSKIHFPDKTSRQNTLIITRPTLHPSPDMSGDGFTHLRPRKISNSSLNQQKAKDEQALESVTSQLNLPSPSPIDPSNPRQSPISPRSRFLPSSTPQSSGTLRTAEPDSLYDTIMQRSWCHRCRKSVVGKSFTALGAAWHPRCFICHDCNKQITSKFFVWHTKTLAGESSQVALCETDYFGRLGLRCHTCSLPIRGPWMTVLGHNYHVGHLLCTTCGIPVKERYFEVVDKVLCRYHYSLDVAERCAYCQTAILDQYTNRTNGADNDKWHPACNAIKEYFGTIPLPHLDLPWPCEYLPGGAVKFPSDTNREALEHYEIVLEKEISRIWSVSGTFVDSFQKNTSDLFREPAKIDKPENLGKLELVVNNVLFLLAAVRKVEALLCGLQGEGLSYANTAKSLSRELMDWMGSVFSSPVTEFGRVIRNSDLIGAATLYLKMLVRICLIGSIVLKQICAEKGQKHRVWNFVDVLGTFQNDIKSQRLPWTTKELVLDWAPRDLDACQVCGEQITNDICFEVGHKWWWHPNCLACIKCPQFYGRDMLGTESKWTKLGTSISCTKGGHPLPQEIAVISEVEQFEHRLTVAYARVVRDHSHLRTIL